VRRTGPDAAIGTECSVRNRKDVRGGVTDTGNTFFFSIINHGPGGADPLPGRTGGVTGGDFGTPKPLAEPKTLNFNRKYDMKTENPQRVASGLFREGTCGRLRGLLPRSGRPLHAAPRSAAPKSRSSLTGAVRALAAVLLCVVLLAGCTKEPADLAGPGTPEGGTVTTQITLTPDFERQIDVKSVDGVDETAIKDVWVIQVNNNVTHQLQDPQYITDITPSAGGGYTFPATLVMDRNSKILFLANSHNPDLCSSGFPATEDDMKRLSIGNIDSESKLVPESGGIPMVGVCNPLQLPCQATLTRIVSKVTFDLSATLPDGESFTLKSVKVKKVPNTVFFYPPEGNTALFPGIDPARWTDEYSAQIFDEDLTEQSKTLWWYLPENQRGWGSATDQKDKNAANAPFRQGDYCTRVEVSGTYTTAAGLITTATYTIFLGANNTDDYNLMRNTHYTLNTQILGQFKSDTRITRDPLNYRDYTDDSSPMFITMSEPLNGIKYNWETALRACPSGWRLPTQQELALIWVYKEGIGPFSDEEENAGFWTSFEYSTEQGVFLRLSDGVISSGDKTFNFYLRCVRDI
jgi:hypothetical protein